VILDFLWSLAMFLIVITLLIAFHEYGHFIVARACGVKVKRFSIGFGKIIWSRTDKKGTEFAISLLPIGGYVKMLDERIEPVPEKDRLYAFNQKSILQRSMIVLAGPFFNFIFAIFAYWLMFVIGVSHIAPIIGDVAPSSIAADAGLQSKQEFIKIANENVYSWQDVSMTLIKQVGNKSHLPITMKTPDNILHQYSLDLTHWIYDGSNPFLLESIGLTPDEPTIPPVINSVQKNSPAAKAGLQKGDSIIAVDQKSISSWQDMVRLISSKANQQVKFVVKNAKGRKTLFVHVGSYKLSSGKVVGFLGVESKKTHWPDNMIRLQRYNPIKALSKAIYKTYDMSVTTLSLLGKMIIGDISFKGISGPVGIAQGAGFSASLGFTHFLSFIALVSVSLGIINLLPLPILDGGHFLFFIIEAVIKRPLPEKVQEISLKIGILLLISVMLLALYNDLSRL